MAIFNAGAELNFLQISSMILPGTIRRQFLSTAKQFPHFLPAMDMPKDGAVQWSAQKPIAAPLALTVSYAIMSSLLEVSRLTNTPL